MKLGRPIRVFLIEFALILTTHVAGAATFQWFGNSSIATGNNNWSTAANWSSSLVPVNDGTADVQIHLGLRTNPVVDDPWSIHALQFQDAGTYSLNGQPLTLDTGIKNLADGTATLNLPLVVANSQTWEAANAPLVVNGSISGSGAQLTIKATQPVTFGGVPPNSFAGQLHVSEGTLALAKSSANGAVKASFLVIGGSGAAPAATVRLDADEQIDHVTSGVVAVSPTGTFDLNGHSESLHNLAVSGNVIGTSGTLTIGDQLSLTGGSVNLLGNATVVAPALVVSLAATTTSSIAVKQMRLATPNTRIDVSPSTPTVDMEITANLVDSSGGASQLAKEGNGLLRLTGNNTYTGTTAVTDGTLRVDNVAGSGTGTSDVNVSSGARLEGNGAIAGHVLISAGGILSPGSDIGGLEMGSLSLDAAATTQLQLGGTLQGITYDTLPVTGAAALGGTLKVSLSSFTPSAGQSFTLLTASSISGTFAVEQLPSVAGVSFDVVYSPTSVVLSALPGVPGDYNSNGIVDAADYTVWRDTLGSTTDLRANGDNAGASAGKIDQADYAVWKSHFGQHLGSGAGAAGTTETSIPEPGGLRLALLGSVLLYCRKQPTTILQRRS
jgi:autotransporter-associated beta strand protein